MTKQTLEQWYVMDSFYPSMKEVVGPSFNVKAVMWATDLTEKDYEERLADLRLIAAAPDMLEALNKWMDQYGGVEYEDCPEVVQTRAAIAKATGKLE